MNGKKKSVYLVGQISPKFDVTYEWRKYVRIHFDFKNDPFNFIDPCGNLFNKRALDKKEYAVQKDRVEWGLNILPHKDLSFVLESDIALVNMNQYDESKPLLGSFFELAWYFIHPEKTVIAWADDLDSYICKHPFVQQAVSVWCEDVRQACRLLEKYFVDVESVELTSTQLRRNIME